MQNNRNQNRLIHFKLSAHSLVRFLTIVFLILIKNVSHIGIEASSTEQQQQHSQPESVLQGATIVDHMNGAGGMGMGMGMPETMADGQSLESLAAVTHRLAKRMDLESCLGQFDVHKNTIIRTGESQAIGGKYLQGLELDTMEECQRLCCETETCDVYIFEDKNDGYCYLFECGPPENFHCKFTRHANYTSAVLTTVRHVTELTTQRPALPHIGTMNISQQELELTNLKMKPETHEKPQSNEGVPMSPVVNGMGSTTINGGSLLSQLPAPEMEYQQKVTNNSAHCGRFQFTCHSGECIAVYNACDGIPQCEDGSDEGPECSGASSSSSVPAPKSSPEQLNLIEPIAPKTASMQSYQPSLMQQTAQQQLQNVQQQQQQQLQQQLQQKSTIINNREDPAAWANRKLVAESQQPMDGINSGDVNSHLFNHKNGIQLPNVGNLQAYQSNGNAQGLNPIYAATLTRSGIYMPQMQDMTGNGIYAPQQQQILTQQGRILLPPNISWQSQIPQQQQAPLPQTVSSPVISSASVQLQQPSGYILNAPPQSQSSASQLLPATGSNSQFVASNDVASNLVPQPSADGVQAAGPAVSLPSVAPAPLNISKASANHGEATSINQKQQDDKNFEENSTDYVDDDEEEESTEPPKKKTRKHKKGKGKNKDSKDATKPKKGALELTVVEPAASHAASAAVAAKQPPAPPSPVHEQFKMIHENLAMEFRDHDGQSERPGGAVLSLTLGLLITAALAILIGCRMRTVGRRARRLGGKTPYSHEADFLVNGMYL